MSQCYHICLKESVTRRVDASDSISYPLELTQILPDADLREILRGVLENDSWIETSPNVFTKTGSAGEDISISLEEMCATATLHEESEVTTEVEAEGYAESWKRARRDAAETLRERTTAVGDQIEESGEKELQKRVTDKLSESEEERSLTLNSVLQQVYAEALKRKAGQLGDILEIAESKGEGGEYELVIRVGT